MHENKPELNQEKSSFQPDYSKILERLKLDNEMLNRKVGNLFFVYENAARMLEEFDADRIAKLTVEIYSSFTGSQLTTLFVKSEISENYEMVSYHCTNKKTKLPKLILFPNKENKLYLPQCTDLTEESQRAIFKLQFHNVNELIDRINPKYVIAMKAGKKIVGFLTLGNQVSDEPYEKETMEISLTLSSAVALAYKLAENSRRTEERMVQLNDKIKNLINLNLLIKNVNSAKTMETVVGLIMSSLNVSYKVSLGFIALYHSDSLSLKIESSINMKGNVKDIPLKGGLLPLLIGEKVITCQEKEAKNLFESKLIKDLDTGFSGACILPICIEEYDVKLIGALGILGLEKGVLTSEDNVMIFEFIATHIAPILYHIQRVETIKQEYHPDYYRSLLELLQINMEEADLFSLELFVVWIGRENRLSFEPLKLENANRFRDVFAVDHQNVLVITTDKEDVRMLGMNVSGGLKVKVFEYRKDFGSVEEFIQAVKNE